MSKFVFLILHYYTYEDTIKCVESIKKLNYKDSEIVIVDNASRNDSGKLLQDKYKNDDKIHIILSKENLGFANGNNLGFEYAKANLNPDFIVMCNNDVYMIQDNFCEKIIEEYNESKFAILGPRILLSGNRICAYEDRMPSIKELKKTRVITKIFYYLNKIYLRRLFSIYYLLKNIIRNKTKSNIIDTSIRKEDVLIHGSCIIFSKEYINEFDGIDNRTFLYYEEQLLYIRIKQKNLKSVYNPLIMIFHNECAATNQSRTNKRKRYDFVLKNELRSLDILIDEVIKYSF